MSSRDVLDLGASVVNRDGRLASGISHNNAQIEKLQRQFMTSQVVWVVLFALWLVMKW
jgi:hypothetical protein